MRPLRVSAISFVNTAPLVHGLLQGGCSRDLELRFDVPSRCAADLREGHADIALIPVAEYADFDDVVLLPDVCIAARGPVRSIFLISNKPLNQIRTVAVDASSRTSVLLLKLLFRAAWGGDRELVRMPPDADAMLAQCDAALIIGDPALKLDRSRYSLVLDLAEEWHRLTALPMVFAVWAVKLGALPEVRTGVALDEVFRSSRDAGLANVRAISEDWSPRLGLSAAAIESYLTQSVSYMLDSEAIRGLERFYTMAVEHGLLAVAPPLRFLGALRLLAGIAR